MFKWWQTSWHIVDWNGWTSTLSNDRLDALLVMSKLFESAQR